MDKDEGNEKLARIRAITKLYYSNPKVQEALLNFSVGREVVPRYFEGFGKRPDTLQYKSDIMGLVNKGATSFHASEEIWNDPLAISSDMSTEKLNELRKSWDLLIDIDSKYLDYSKIAAKLMIQAIESFGINNYGIKFSGSRGFHIIISGEAFPEEYDGSLRKDKFPEWPRAICEYLTMGIRPRYNEVVSKLDINFDALEKRTNLSKEDITEVICPKCGRQANKGNTVHYQCPDCRFEIKRKDVKEYYVFGNPTEIALSIAAAKAGIIKERVNAKKISNGLVSDVKNKYSFTMEGNIKGKTARIAYSNQWTNNAG